MGARVQRVFGFCGSGFWELEGSGEGARVECGVQALEPLWGSGLLKLEISCSIS